MLKKVRLENLIALVIIGLALLLIRFMLQRSGPDLVSTAQHAVETQGYTEVQYTGVDSFACGKVAGYAFDATNGNGARVHLVACNPNGLINYTKGWYVVSR